MEICLAVMSDLHCHPTMDNPTSYLLSDGPIIPANQHPIASLIKLIERESLNADALLVPGDLADQSNTQGLTAAWRFVDDVGRALGTSLAAATLGNHDINSHGPAGSDPFEVVRTRLHNFPVQPEEQQRAFWARGFCHISSDALSLRVLIVNSVYHHTTAEELEQGRLSNPDYARRA